MLNVNDLTQLELILYEEEEDQSESEEGSPNQKVKAKNVKKFVQLYKNISLLGSGGFGIVVACKERLTGRNIAMKIAAYNRKTPN